jgi:hypothetical protein
MAGSFIRETFISGYSHPEEWPYYTIAAPKEGIISYPWMSPSILTVLERFLYQR